MSIKPKIDISFDGHGSIYFLRAVTAEGQDWIDEHVCRHGYQPYDNRIVVEHRYVRAIINGAARDGLGVEVV